MEKYSRFHLSEVHVQKQKTEWWSPGAGEEKEVKSCFLMDIKFLFT